MFVDYLSTSRNIAHLLQKIFKTKSFQFVDSGQCFQAVRQHQDRVAEQGQLGHSQGISLHHLRPRETGELCLSRFTTRFAIT
jgi:hypothetical protein